MIKQSSISNMVPLITFTSIKLTQIIGFPYMQRSNFGRKKKNYKKIHIRKTPPYTKRKFLVAYSQKKKKKIINKRRKRKKKKERLA